MLGVNYLAVVVAAVVAFVMGGLWYSPLLFGKPWAELRVIDSAGAGGAQMRPPEILAEFVRSLIVAIVFAGFVVLSGLGYFSSVELLAASYQR